jgi:hypothetical protein
MSGEDTDVTATTESASAGAPGILEGGWPYVWGAYGLTWAFLAGYAIYLLARRIR